MDLVNSIANLSVAKSMVETRMAASAKVLKMAQGSQQVAADLITQTVEDITEMTEQFARDAGSHFAAFA